MKHIRLATKEEIEAIRDRADLLPGHTQVLAWDADNGTPDVAVVRNCVEIDPVVYGSGTNDFRRSKFFFALEERFLGMGVDRYYFQIPAADEHYIKVMKHWGAEQVSKEPEVRFLKVIE